MTTVLLPPEVEAILPRWKPTVADVADEIRKAVTAPGAGFLGAQRDKGFDDIRAEVRGAMLRAWAKLVPDGRYLPVDDRIFDLVDQWLMQKKQGPS